MAEEPDDPKDRRRRDRTPFDDIMRGFGIEPSEFDRMFEDMQRALQDMLRQGTFEPGKPYVHGFSFKVGPDGKPIVTEFGNRPGKPHEGKPTFTEERVPLTELLDENDKVAVTVELPGVDKKDIDLHVTENQLEVTVNNEKRRYHKTFDFAQPVKPDTTKASYKNGILDITIQKDTPKAPKGRRVQID